MPINAAWPKKHPMGMGTTLDQRIKWHVAHAKACDCRKQDLPPTILKELKRRGEEPPARKTPPKGSPKRPPK